MLASTRLTRAALLSLVVGLLAALMAVGAAPGAHAADRILVYGRVGFPQGDNPNLKVLWFDSGWGYLGQQRADGGGYSLRLPPGTYHLQFVDQRPAYEVRKYAPTNIQVTLRDRPVAKNVVMRKGAAITGAARAGGRPLAGARVVAANQAEQSFPTISDKKGRFAIGGLPAGKYCLFTFDKARRWVDKCTWVGGLDTGQFKDAKTRLRKQAGSLTVFLTTASNGTPPRSTVTVTSKRTGQWWTATARDGKAVLSGLHPGGYSIKYDGAGIWLTQLGSVRHASVSSGRMEFGDFRLTQRGGWIRGNVVDSSDETRPLAEAVVQLWSASGTKLAESISSDDGSFDLKGQLTTQEGLTIVVQPGQYTDYLGVGPLRCQYVATPHEGYNVTTGEENYIGDIGIDRKPGQDKSGCATSTDRAGRHQPIAMSSSPQ